MMVLPVSVVVPHKVSRASFFRRFSLPSILANNPCEVIIEPNDGTSGSGARFRNSGFRKARSPFVFFCDDDVILAANCLDILLSGLTFCKDPAVGYAYCDYVGVVMPGGTKTEDHSVFLQRCSDFDPLALRRGSLCSSMMLIEKDKIPAGGFDPDLPQLDDWDFCLTLCEAGVHGVRVPEPLFHAYFLDVGVTDRATSAGAVHAVQRKHGMRVGGNG